MKYGILLRNYGEYADRIAGYNVGDAIQDYTLSRIYDHMGIPGSMRQYIRLDELQSYAGEYVLLPMFGFGISDVGMGALPLSPRIIPLFSSSVFIKSGLSDECVAYLRHFEPIGCRDEFSMRSLRELGLLCSITGCITMTLPKRERHPKNGKTFIVDIPKELIERIPSKIRDGAEVVTHLLPLGKGRCDTDEQAKAYYDDSINLLKRYRDEASLVISSRLHAIAPCIAMGIPVVALTENITQRFSWLDKYIKIHTEETLDQIDWSPRPLEIEPEKEMITSYFESEIREAYNKWNNRLSLSEFYEDREKSLYGSRYIRIINEQLGGSGVFSYAIWGCGLIGENVYQIMTSAFPEARCVSVIDTYVRGKFHGMEIQAPDVLPLPRGTILLLASYSGRVDALKLMKELGLQEGADYIYLATQNG